jgi:hypothetical protein
MFRIPHCIDDRFTDDSEVVGLTNRPRSVPDTSLFLALVLISVRGLSKPSDQVWPEGLDKLKTFNDIIGSRTSDLPTCKTVPQAVRCGMVLLPYGGLLVYLTMLMQQPCEWYVNSWVSGKVTQGF